MVEHGATTMWERWNGDQMRGDASMTSYNHYAYGAVADWLYRYTAGIDATPSDAGFHTIKLHPVFDRRIGHIALDYESVYGRIHFDWTVQGPTAVWHFSIPANTTAALRLNQDQMQNCHLVNAQSLNKYVSLTKGENDTSLLTVM
jgi:alpha-L-rhamnosidase